MQGENAVVNTAILYSTRSSKTLKPRTANICTVHEVFVDWFQLQAPENIHKQVWEQKSVAGGAIFGNGVCYFHGNPMPPITCIASDVMASVAGWPVARGKAWCMELFSRNVTS